MQVGNTVIKSFLAVCPSCRREGNARPPRDGWSRRYLCLGCGASWGTFDIVRQRDAATSPTGVRTWRHATAVSGKRRLAHPEPAILRMARGYALCFTQSGNVNCLLKDGADSRVREFPYFYSKRGVLGCATTFQGGPMAQTLATAPATSLPWAWRLFRAPDSDDERRIHQDRTGTATRSPGPKTRRVRTPCSSVSHRAASQMRWSTSGPGWPPETQPRADSRAPRKVSRAAAMRPLLCTATRLARS